MTKEQQLRILAICVVGAFWIVKNLLYSGNDEDEEDEDEY